MSDLTRADCDFLSVYSSTPISKFEDGTGWVAVNIALGDYALVADLSGVGAFEGGLFVPKTSVATATNEGELTFDVRFDEDYAASLFTMSPDFVTPTANMLIVRFGELIFCQGYDGHNKLFRISNTSGFKTVVAAARDYTGAPSGQDGRRQRLTMDASLLLAGWTPVLLDEVIVGTTGSGLVGLSSRTAVGALSGTGANGTQALSYNNLSFSDVSGLSVTDHPDYAGSVTITCDGVGGLQNGSAIAVDNLGSTVSPVFGASDLPPNTEALVIDDTNVVDVSVASPYRSLTYGRPYRIQQLEAEIRMPTLTSGSFEARIYGGITRSSPTLTRYGYYGRVQLSGTSTTVSSELADNNFSTIFTGSGLTITTEDWVKLRMTIEGETDPTYPRIILEMDLLDGSGYQVLFDYIDTAATDTVIADPFAYVMFAEILFTSATSTNAMIQNVTHTLTVGAP